jgi:hypothetical protein
MRLQHNCLALAAEFQALAGVLHLRANSSEGDFGNECENGKKSLLNRNLFFQYVATETRSTLGSEEKLRPQSV